MDIFVTGSARVYSMGQTFDDWDGRWLAVMPTIPHARRAARRPLYAGLTWAGFGDPAPGLWLTPHVERADEIRELIAELDLVAHTVSLVGTVESIGMASAEVVARGWDLDALAEHYEGVAERVEAQHPPGPAERAKWHALARTAPRPAGRAGVVPGDR